MAPKRSQWLRLEQLERKLRLGDENVLEVLNPRFWERDDRSITQEQWDAANAARVAAAHKAGLRVIKIHPLKY